MAAHKQVAYDEDIVEVDTCLTEELPLSSCAFWLYLLENLR
jgi:hypothetical protein